MSTNSEILDKLIQGQIDMTRYSNTVVRDVTKLLNAADKDMVKQMQARDVSNWTTRRINAMLNELQKITAESYDKAATMTQADMLEFATIKAQLTGATIDGAIPVEAGLSVALPSAEQLAAIVATSPISVGESGALLLEEIFHGLADGKEKRIRQTIRLGMVEGRTIDQMAKDLIGTKAAKYSDGIIETDRRGVEAMVRTIVNDTNNKAAQSVYTANNDILKGVQWHSTLDSRTSPICRARDGVVYPVNSGPRPPAHISCRSFVVPVVKSLSELGMKGKEFKQSTRASMDGQVPETVNYNEWLKTKPVEFQDKVLGPKRAALYRSGKYDLKDFINNKGETIRLDQL